MKHSFIYLFVLTVFGVFASCKGDDNDLSIAQYAGMDQVSRIELSPNSPQLIADGTAQLKFKIKCYYRLGKDTVEHKMVDDRIDKSEIFITSSDGKTFKVNGTYSTKELGDSVFFTCTYKNLTSKKIGVKLTAPEQLSYEPITVPIIFHGLYSTQTENNVVNLTKEKLQPMIDKLNKAFAGTPTAPSSANSGIQFKIARIDKEKVSPEVEDDAMKLKDYIVKNDMKDYQHYLHIWVHNAYMWNFSNDNCIPKYTFGKASDIPGLDLQEITKDKLSTIEVTPEMIGFPITYVYLYKYIGGNDNDSFARHIGQYYGLINTASSSQGQEDADGCPDTFSYEAVFDTHEKDAYDTHGNYFFYDSFNIMDKISSHNTISRDQVKRIRQVIKDCPFRNMKE